MKAQANNQFIIEDLRDIGVKELISSELFRYDIPIFFDPDQGDGGSGTLVVYKGLKGILTATHVTAEIQNRKTLTLPCSLRKGTQGIWECQEIPFLRILTIDDLKSSLMRNKRLNLDKILDIAFIQIESKTFEKLLASWDKRPINLKAFNRKYTRNPSRYWSSENANGWVWVISGHPREGTGYSSESLGVKTMPFSGAYIGGGETKIQHQGLELTEKGYENIEVDLIDTDNGPTTDILPRSFEGISGGGTWQIKLFLSDGNLRIDEIFFAGVVVTENDDGKYLRSRGPVALYDVFCGFLDERINDNKIE